MNTNKEKNKLLLNNPLWIVDVGASGGIHPKWRSFYPFYNGIMFEPNLREYEKLKANNEKNLTILNVALSNSISNTDFYLCRKNEVSSVYLPNFDILDKFPNSERFEVLKTIKLQTDTLNHQLKKNNFSEVDFIKIDTQGSELNILNGATNYLEKLIGLEIEVSFLELYKDQPLFSQIDQFVKNYGFELFDLKRYYWKRKLSEDTGIQKGQLVFGDALYLRTPEGLLSINNITLL